MDFLPDSLPHAVYFAALFGPFVQEDAAVIAAATASATHMGETLPLFLLLWVGLFFSDIWKYWIGWGALKVPRFGRYAEKKHVADFRDKVMQFPISTMFVARFVPLTRIPTYVAFGFFKVNYIKFCVMIACTAFVYVSIAFGLSHLLGELLGENLIWVLPVIGLTYLVALISWTFFKRRAL